MIEMVVENGHKENCWVGICGELAEARRLKYGTGNATFRTDLIDAVFNLTEEQLMEGIRYEVY